jgi:UDPglucose 6-dehydrogenase
MNELAMLCEVLGADIEAVRLGAGSDNRIGPRFLFAGTGFGGSCFPKDIRALQKMGEQAGVPLLIPGAVEKINARQKRLLGEKAIARFGADLSGRVFGLWGLAFKPRTDDVREAPAFVVMQMLLDAGASIRAYDPEAMDEARREVAEWPARDRVTFVDSALDAARGVDALMLVTEWAEFRNPDLDALGTVMRSRVILDGRNVLAPEVVTEAGFVYEGVGRLAPRGN